MDRVPHRVPCPRRGPGQPEKNSDQGYILAPNHISAIDPVFVIITRFWGRRMIVFAKKELFEINAFLSWFFRCAGAMCVRGTKEEAAVIDETVAVARTVRACSSSRRAPVRKTERSCSQRAACSSLRQRLLWTWCPVRIHYETPDGKMKLFCKDAGGVRRADARRPFAMESRRDMKKLRANKQALLDAWEKL